MSAVRKESDLMMNVMTEPGRVKGSTIRAHIDWVRDHGSREETIELFAALPRPVRAQVSTVAPDSLYDRSLLLEVDRAILGLFGRGELRFLETVGAWAARLELAGVRHPRLEDVHDFFARTTADYRRDGERTGTIVQRYEGACSPLLCASSAGYYRECLLLHGAERASVVEVACKCAGDEACTFALRWS